MSDITKIPIIELLPNVALTIKQPWASLIIIMRDAAEKAQRAAETMEDAARRIELLIADGYGGNGAMLLEALQNLPASIQIESSG